MSGNAERPLRGVRVVDLTHVLAGPYCTYQLALLGAEVVKAEMPGGEWMRRPAAPGASGPAAGFVAQAAGKRMAAIDVSRPEGAALVRAMIPLADVFVENLTPGVAAGYGPEGTVGAVGADTAAVLGELGYDDDAIAGLAARGTIGLG